MLQGDIMPYSKSFPRTSDKSGHTLWEEIYLTTGEEAEQEQRTRSENIALMKECIEDVKKIIADKNLKPYQTDLIHMAIALFEKRASHTVYYKEEKAKEKFDKKFT
jgi:hypothetical protein